MMPSIEDICNRIFSDKKGLIKLLIGGLLMMSIFGIPLAMGYYHRYLQQIRMTGKVDLPEWTHWKEDLIPGLLFTLVFLIFFVVPVLVGSLLGNIVGYLSFGIFGATPFMAMSLVGLIAPSLTLSAFIILQRERYFLALLDFRKIVYPLVALFKEFLIPSLLFVGICAVGGPLFPFAFFAGFAVFLGFAAPRLLSAKS